MKRIFLSTLIIIGANVMVACAKEIPQSNGAASDVSSPAPTEVVNSPAISEVNGEMKSFSSDQLGICFSYPKGYSQEPNSETVNIAGPELQSTDTKGRFWLEISEAYDRTAKTIADQDMTFATGIDVDRWITTLDGELAEVLDGMPGQDLQRRVYVVHGQTLYILGFMPTHSENRAATSQMETLYTAVMDSWEWSPCPPSE
jgi:hypothetical protein